MIRFINVPEGGRLKVRLLFDNSIDPAGFSFHGGNASVMDGQAPPSISFTTEVLGREVVMTSSEIGLWPASIPYEIRVSRNSDNSSWLVLEGGINVETVAAGDAPLGEGVDGDAEAGEGAYVPEYDPQTVVLTVSEEEGRIVFGPYSGGGGGGGDVYKDLNNVFTGVNTFNNHAVKANAGVEVGEAGGESVEHTIYRSGDDLYWGDTKLNCQGGGGGDVCAGGDNCFTGVNRFWNDCGVTLGNTAKTAGRSLKNQDNNLYWGDCKVVVSGTLNSYVTKTALAGCGYAKSSALNSYVTKSALSGCGFARSACTNVFTAVNKFDGGIDMGSSAIVFSTGRKAVSSCKQLYRKCDDLYWGTTKLNGGGGGGDVYSCCDNVFTGYNTFDGGASFYSCTSFNNVARFNDLGCQTGGAILYNYDGDLYWGCTKLNCQGGGGGGDVTSDGNNCFTGVNKFWNDDGIILGNTAKSYGLALKYDCGDLAWGDCEVVMSGTLNGYVTKTALAGCGYAKSSALNSYVTKTALAGCGYAKSSALNSYVTKSALSGCGFAKQGDNNVFTGDNTFAGGSVFNTWTEFYGDTTFHKHVNIADGGSDISSDARLQNHNGDLYWGSSKLNDQGGGGGGGDVYKDGCNVFTGKNDFQVGLYMTECTGMECSKLSRDSDGNLYWGYTKLNGGGGDVAAAGNNCFTGCNKFIKGLYIPACSGTDTGKLSADSHGNLYWGDSKLNCQGGGGDVTKAGNNCFTGVNRFYNTSGVVLGTSASAKRCLKYSGGSLYWGTDKVVTSSVLSGCGFASEDKPNTFNSSNVFNSCITVNGNIHLKGKLRGRDTGTSVDLGSGLILSDSYGGPIAGVQCYKLYRVCSDLYWGGSKLNDQGGGGGDVTSGGNNSFTGFNKFYNSNGIAIGTNASNNKQLKYVSGSLYWGTCAVATTGDLAGFVTKSVLSSCRFAHKSDISNLADKAGNNEFTGTNTFKGGVLFNSTCAVDLGSSGVRVRNIGDCVPDCSTCTLVNSNGDLYWGTSVIGSLPDSRAYVIGCGSYDCTSLRNNKAYKVEFPPTATSVVRDISGIQVCSMAAAEIGVDMRYCQHRVTWPSCWYWLDGTSADGGDHNVHPSVLDWGSYPMHHTVAVRRDEWKVLAHVLYSYRIPGLPDASQGTE